MELDTPLGERPSAASTWEAATALDWHAAPEETAMLSPSNRMIRSAEETPRNKMFALLGRRLCRPPVQEDVGI